MSTERQPITDPEGLLDQHMTAAYKLAATHFRQNIKSSDQTLPIEIGPTAKTALLNTLSTTQGITSRTTPESILEALITAGVYSETDSDPAPMMHNNDNTAKPAEPELFRGEIELRPAKLDAVAAAILAHNLSVANTQQNRREFYSQDHIQAMVDQISNWYEFSPEQEQELRSAFIDKDLYTEAEINEAIHIIKGTLKALHEKELSGPERLVYFKKLAILSERGLALALAIHEWFGTTIKLTPTHIYDDLRAKTDCVLENIDAIKKSMSHTAIDATFSLINSEKFGRKITDVLESIRTNQPTTLRFYTDSKGNKYKNLALPRLILHLDDSEVNLLLHITEGAQSGNTNNPEYQSPEQRHTILRKLIEQTQVFIDVADHYNNTTMKQAYETTLRTLRAAARFAKLVIPEGSEKLPITKKIRDIANAYCTNHTNNSADVLQAIQNLSFGR